MTTLFKLAWRNIWRNKRRTLITTSAIAFAVFFASFMSSFQKGAWDNIIDSSINMFFGYAQIHGAGYWDEQTLDKAIEMKGPLLTIDSSVPQVAYTVPRLESFALASYKESTAGVMVIGIDADKENRMTDLASKMTEGNYLTTGDEGAIIAGGVAQKLKLKVNDTLVIISQGFHGVNAAGKFPIRGIFNFSLPDLNKRLVYLSLPAAQKFYGAENRVTSLAMKIDDRKEVPQAILAIKQQLPKDGYEVKSWEEMIPELLDARKLDSAGNVLILALLYVIIFFGIFGTIIMMTKEREYEFGVLTAIGMTKWKLFAAIWMETVMLGILGSIIGILLSIPLCYYMSVTPLDVSAFGEGAVEAYEKFGIQPVLQGAFEWNIFFQQALIIFIATTLMAFYPLLKIMTLRPVEAMRA